MPKKICRLLKKRRLEKEKEPLGSTSSSNSSSKNNSSENKMGFSIGRTVGHGTYSKVCLAKDQHGQKMACKIIDKKHAGTDFIRKFLPREIRILCNIQHPNIIQVFKILEINDVIYIFMDYCSNGDLLEFIKSHGPFNEDVAKKIFKQIVDAVAYLHNKEIAHRDLKCENVLLMSDNHVKLGDFGFARSCIDAAGKKMLSDTFCGSAAYAAPEILQGISYDPKKYDMWALGCILYIMFSASMPFDDSNIKKMIRQQLNRSICTKTMLWPENTMQLKKLINRLLEPDVAKRVNIRDVLSSPWLDDSNLGKIKRLLSISDSGLFI